MSFLKELTRKVGEESSKSYKRRLESGFFEKYMSGTGLDVGYAGYIEGALPILSSALGLDLNYPGYDGVIIPFPDNGFDYVYNSHCLEHISDYKASIREWYRVTKVNGHIVIVVPHMYLYEKKLSLQSRWNGDHKRFYTPSSLLKEIEESLTPNSYRVRLIEDGDTGFDYTIPPQKHSGGEYEITLVIQKIQEPAWQLK